MARLPGLIVCILALTIAFAAPSYGWNNRGHMMVAAVAYKKLDQATKDKVDALLKLNPDRDNWVALIPAGTSAANKKKFIFIIAATWPDRIKSDHDYQTDGTHGGNRPPADATAGQNIGYEDLARHKYWHFVDEPFGPTGVTLPEVPTPNAQVMIATFRETLASDTAKKKLKSYDLSWLLHLVGDVHQPLHCVTRITPDDPDGDDGGNGVKLTAPSNLHSYWDSAAGGDSTIAAAATAGESLPAAAAADANNLKVEDWIAESVDLAKTQAYKHPPVSEDDEETSTLTDSYKAKAKAVALQRVALAGARLANILKNELK